MKPANAAFPLLALMLTGAPLAADEAAPDIDSKSREVLQAFSDTLTGADSFSADLSMAMEMRGEGMDNVIQSTYGIAVQRPAQFAFRFQTGMGGASIASDGGTLVTYFPMVEKFVEEEAPDRIEEIPDAGSAWAFAAGTAMGGLDFIKVLIAEDPYATLVEEVKTISHQGEEELDGQPVHRIRFEEQEITWDGWFAADNGLLIKLVPDFSSVIEQMKGRMPGMDDIEMEMRIELADWTLGQPMSDDLFVLEIPDEVEKVDSMAAVFASAQGGGESEQIGQPAPGFELDTLNGESVSLEDLEGKIAILDFWATWCGPCVKALPALTAAASAYEDRGVVLYGINQREDEETIRAFMEKRDLDFPVALDRDGAVGAEYGVRGIPHTVIIDRDGIIRHVHVGFLPGLEKQLKEELEALVDPGASDEPGRE